MKITNKRIVISTLVVAVMFLGVSAWAHKPLLSVEDNEDGTVYIEVGFSDGSSGSGHKLIVQEKSSGKVLQEHTVPADSYIDLPMPKVPYIVVFDAGPGHVVETEGPFVEQIGGAAEVEDLSESSEVVQPAVPQVVPAKVSVAKVAAVQPVVVSSPAVNGAGFDMAFKMMIINQIIMAVILSFILGICCFWIGYTVGKKK